MNFESSKRKPMSKKVLLIFWVLVGVSLMLVAFLYTSPLLFTERLRVDEFERRQTDVYTTKVWDSDGNELAHPYFRIPSETLRTPCEILFSVWHAQETKMDSLTLIFSSNDYFELALQAPGGFPWPRTDFHKTSDGKGVILDIPNMETQGRGTVTLRFYLQSFSDYVSLNVHLKFSLHKETPFSLTRYTADTNLQAIVEIL